MLRRVVPLFVAFVAVHVVVGILGYQQPNEPMGDVYLVYEPWSRCALFGGIDVSSCTRSDAWAWPGITEKWIYPQLAFLPMTFAWVFAWAVGYTPAWAITVALFNLVAFVVLVGTGRSTGRVLAAWFWLAAILLIGPVGLYRIDGITVPFAILGSIWMLRRPFVASLLLSISVWMKVWPAAILATGLIVVRRRLALIGGAVAVSLATIIPVVALGGAPYVFGFVGDQTSRGIQMEAPVGGLYMFLAAFYVPGSEVYYDGGVLTFQVTGPGAEPLIAAMTPIMLLTMVAVAVVGVMKMRRGATFLSLFPPLSLALVTAFIALNKVGSPQYYVWLFAPVVLGLMIDRRRWYAFAGMTLVIAALTQWMYPLMYDGLMATHPNPFPVVVLEARNLLALVLLVWAIVRVVRVPTGRVRPPAGLREIVTGRRPIPARVPSGR
ncbi:glycosyltransferase family 87 protein [Microbacterium sp. SL62]|uniref:glycosyltransferase family 87 protein n=1 Tax=Microbacterium sp. SL62 TaxID=2995139 RepID=UPI0022736446|nr:glycosyltransferase family 87 protein [Microbacterium sp. SL62]MCY1716618.1 glycosyltransferase family 87 protein [Microbacterium sp. SL62]